MARKNHDTRSHRLVAIIGFIDGKGRKQLLILNGGSSLFPGTPFLAASGNEDTAKSGIKQGRTTALNSLLRSFGLNGHVTVGFAESDKRRAGGGHKFYAFGKLRGRVPPNSCTLVSLSLEKVIERLTAQEDEGRCTPQFIDRVFEAADGLSQHELDIAA